MQISNKVIQTVKRWQTNNEREINEEKLRKNKQNEMQ